MFQIFLDQFHWFQSQKRKHLKFVDSNFLKNLTTAILILRFHIPDEHRNPQVQLNYFARALIGGELWIYLVFEQREI